MRNWSLRLRLMGLGLAIALLVPTVGGFIMYENGQSNKEYAQVSDIVLPKMKALGNLLFKFRQIRISVRSIPLAGNTRAHLEQYAEESQSAVKVFETEKDAIKNQTRDAEGLKIIEKIDSSWAEFKSFGGDVLALAKKGDDASMAEAARLVRDVCPKKTASIESAILEFIEYESTRAESQVAQAKELVTFVHTTSIAGMILGVLAALAGVLVFSSWLNRRMRAVVDSIEGSSNEVGSATSQLRTSSLGLSTSSSEAAANLEETVSSLEELSSMANTNADRAHRAETLSDACMQTASKTESFSKQLNSAMQEITKSSNKIEEIINVIDDISFQTNLLALNAAVEAARAGEQGKGFAVVAEAVRALAQRSAFSAKEISTLIKESVEKTAAGEVLANDSEVALGELIDNIRKITTLNQEISSANKESSAGVTQISQAMNQIDQSTQQNASLAEESAGMAEQLDSQASLLKASAHDLKLLLDGNTDRETHSGANSGSARGSQREHHVERIRGSRAA